MDYLFTTYILLLSIIILCSLFSKQNNLEGFESSNRSSSKSNNNTKSYILLGDSILKNNSYVNDGKNIESLMTERSTNVHCYAVDHSTISDVFSQVGQISTDLNTPNTYIFLSAGGNNILSHYVDRNEDVTDSSVLKPMFASYKNLIKSIQTRLPKAKIILLDIYYPDNMRYKQFHSIIKEWNSMLYAFAQDPKSNIYGVIRISDHLTQNDDFSFGIEPSSNGGKKIVDLILSTE